MRAFALSLLVLLLLSPGAACAETDIAEACYFGCETKTSSNPEYKACLARAADKADGALNDSYKKLQNAIRIAAKDMGQPPEAQLAALKDAQKSWIAYRDANCGFEDSLAFGGTASGGYYSACLCALSYGRANDFERIRKHGLFSEE
jgi:uncharacterized protein YecT (DUF1311 family)